jgi:acetyl-CoA C-acetyltransferase
VPRAAIITPVRTAVGAFGKSLRPVAVEDLGATVVNAVIKRSGIDPALIEDVVFAQSYASRARRPASDAGSRSRPASLSTSQACSSIAAVEAGCRPLRPAAMMVQTGAADVVVAGGVESMSNIEYYTTDLRWGSAPATSRCTTAWTAAASGHSLSNASAISQSMIETAENVAKRYGITREESDAFAMSSHQKAQLPHGKAAAFR